MTDDEPLESGKSDHDTTSDVPLSLDSPVSPQLPQEALLPSSPLAGSSIGESTDTDDDYDLSDDDDVILSSPEHVGFSSSLTEHANYFSGTLSQALDSMELDKSLALQAKLSGHLNNENQKIIEKKEKLAAHLKVIQGLFKDNFSPDANSKLSRVEQMSKDLSDIEERLYRLKNGKTKGSYALSFLRSTNHIKVGVSKKYPIEYNQARDKVLERHFEEEI